MRDEARILASTLTPCPIIARQRRMRALRAAVASTALIAAIAIAVVGALWFVCFGVVTQ